MAAVRNAFDLLAGSGESQPALPVGGSSKAKKKTKKKPHQATVPAAGSEPADPITAAPVAQQPPKAQTARDAGQTLEASAVAAGPGEWSELARNWTDQVLGGDALFADGNQLVDFKQVLLKSRALHLLIAGCLERGASVADEPALAQLLASVAHPSTPPAFSHALAQAVASLGAVCATDRLAPTPAAKRSAAAALSLLLSGVPKPPPLEPREAPSALLKRLSAELGKQEARLATAGQPKELVRAYSSILEVLCGQLDVLRPENGAAGPPLAPEVAAAMKPLDELRGALASRLQEVQAPPKQQLSIPEQLAEAEAAFRREDGALVGRLADTEARIASLEAELAALKGEAGELRSRRAAGKQLLAHRLEAIRSGRAESGATAVEIAQAVQGGLGALEGLAGALRGGRAAANGTAAPADLVALSEQVVAWEVPVKLLGAVQQVVELSVGQLQELGAKAAFFRERLQKAIKQGEQAARLGLGDPKVFKQQRDTAENNVREVLAAAEAAAGAARAAALAYRQRLPVMLRLPSFLPPPPDYISALEARAAEAQALLESIRDGTFVPPPPAAAAPAPAAHAPERAATANGAAPDVATDVTSLEARLAALEAENVKKDAQIAAMVSTTTLDVPSPLAGRASVPPAMLSTPTTNKPTAPAAPIAPATAVPLADDAPAPEPVSAPAANGMAAANGAAPISWSQALLQQPQANGRKPAPRPRRA